jgi:hypothetical protein
MALFPGNMGSFRIISAMTQAKFIAIPDDHTSIAFV